MLCQVTSGKNRNEVDWQSIGPAGAPPGAAKHILSPQHLEITAMALGMAIGIGLGAAVGPILFEDAAMGITFGVAIGAAVGAVVNRK